MTGFGRAAVIGASGLVGSALVRKLLDDGWEVTATVRDESAAARVGNALHGARVATLVDALDGESIRELLADSRPTVVVNCVSTNPTSGGEAARAYGNGNVTAVAVTLDACSRAKGVRVIVFGSGFEYAPASYPLAEDQPIGSTTLYGATKAAGSVIARYFREVTCMDVCVVRPFSIYGQRERRGRFVPYIITSALLARPIEMSTGTQRRDYLYAGDLAEGLARLACHEGPLPEVLNFSGPAEHSLLDIASIVVEITDSPAPLRVGARPGRPDDRPVFLGDSRLARDTLGWRPAHDLRSGLAETVGWYRAHRDFWQESA